MKISTINVKFKIILKHIITVYYTVMNNKFNSKYFYSNKAYLNSILKISKKLYNCYLLR